LFALIIEKSGFSVLYKTSQETISFKATHNFHHKITSPYQHTQLELWSVQQMSVPEYGIRNNTLGLDVK